MTSCWHTGAMAIAPLTVRLAHTASLVALEPGPVVARREREEVEDQLLVQGATRSTGAGERLRPEVADALRTCFERDRDRILHSPAFRRLAGKTQVFIFPEDHQRTRLTHALEVAQVATAVARATRLNVALTEAIALGHDCGHGPGGHASEEALSPYLPEGYDHAVWGADVVLAPLNLCTQTLDGIRNHSWSRPSPSTPEAEVVSWADRIAYVCHDFEDAVRAGIVTTAMLPDAVMQGCGPQRSTQLETFINGLVDVIHRTGQVAMPEELAGALDAFRDCNYTHIYLRPASVAQGRAVVDVLRALVDHLADRPGLIVGSGPGHGQHEPGGTNRGPSAGSEEAVRTAVTYVGGMTDRYACRMALARLDWDRDRLPGGMSNC